MITRIANWIGQEPFLSLLVLLTLIGWAIFVFIQTKDNQVTFWLWLRRIIVVFATWMLFVGLLGIFNILLQRNLDTYQTLHGSFVAPESLSAIGWRATRALWGGSIIQYDLIVKQFVEQEIQQELPVSDITSAPRYRTVTQRVEIPQDSVVGFHGVVEIEHTGQDQRDKGEPAYNSLMIYATYEYQVQNTAETETEAEFTFPLTPTHRLITDFNVLLNGESISPRLLFSPGGVSWVHKMSPGQSDQIIVKYTSQGTESYTYLIRENRSIRNFIFEVNVTNTRLFSLYIFPSGENIGYERSSISDGKGEHIYWKMDNIFVAPRLDIVMTQLPQPYAPSDTTLRMLQHSPNGLILLVTLLTLTFFLQNTPPRFSELLLLCAIYSAFFLTLAGLSSFLSFNGALLCGALLTLPMAVLFSRHFSSRVLQFTTFTLFGIFILLYPRISLAENIVRQQQLEYSAQGAIIFYLFGFALFSRLQNKNKPANPPSTQPTD